MTGPDPCEFGGVCSDPIISAQSKLYGSLLWLHVSYSLKRLQSGEGRGYHTPDQRPIYDGASRPYSRQSPKPPTRRPVHTRPNRRIAIMSLNWPKQLLGIHSDEPAAVRIVPVCRSDNSCRGVRTNVWPHVGPAREGQSMPDGWVVIKPDDTVTKRIARTADTLHDANRLSTDTTLNPIRNKAQRVR